MEHQFSLTSDYTLIFKYNGWLCCSRLPFPGQIDVGLLGAAFAQGEELSHYFLGFSHNQCGAGLQLGITLLEGQVSWPELGNRGDIQKPVSWQPLQESFEFIWKKHKRDMERVKNEITEVNLMISRILFESFKTLFQYISLLGV